MIRKPADDGHFRKSNPLLKHNGKMKMSEQTLKVKKLFKYQVDA